MKEIILDAVKRTMKPSQCREAGLTPGVLYGDGVTAAVPVQFETAGLKKIIATHGWNAKVWVRYGDNKKFGYIKEVQRHPVTATVIHIDIFLVSQDHEVSMQIPIVFDGRDKLDNIVLQVFTSEIEVSGKIALIPQTVVVDVSAMVLGETITSESFNLDKQLRITENENEVYGVIIPLRELAEEPENVAVEETATEA